MAEEERQRKLSTILAMDVVNYTAKMGLNEVGTLEQLAACRKIIQQEIKTQKGRIFNTAGDSFMIEFASPVSAVTAAISIQRQVKIRNQSLTEQDQLEFRVGINIGDVILEGENLFGDGVNVAARLEGISPPGGICISEMIKSVVDGKVDAEFVDQGLQNLKNVEKPVRAFYLEIEKGSEQARKYRPLSQKSSLPFKWIMSGALGATLIGIFLFFQISDEAPQRVTEFNRIAVLPLDSLGGDSQQTSLAIGLSQDLGNSLTRVADDLAIIKLDTRPEDLSKVSGQTGANYIIEGNVRRGGNDIRVSVSLIDATDMTSLWAKAYDRKMEGSNIFRLQDEIVNDIVQQLVGAGAVLTKDLNKRAAKKGTENLTAYECVNFARGVAIGGIGKEDNKKAMECLKEAVELDPYYADAWRWYALVTSWIYSTFDGNKSLLKDAAKYAAKAVSLDTEDGEAYAVQAEIAYYNGDWKTMFDAIDLALDLIPGNAFVVGQAAWITAMGGECTTLDSTQKEASSKKSENQDCRWQKGCWELGLKAQELDIGNIVVYDNYLLCNCYNVIREGDKALNALLPLQHTEYHWWNTQVGMAYHMAGDIEKANFHLQKTQKLLDTNKLEDLRSHFVIWNMTKQIWPVYEPILKEYGWE